jgi:uncharacterized membrane protein YeaQ/YmgE (transglycosylase-associated protein family)
MPSSSNTVELSGFLALLLVMVGGAFGALAYVSVEYLPEGLGFLVAIVCGLVGMFVLASLYKQQLNSLPIMGGELSALQKLGVYLVVPANVLLWLALLGMALQLLVAHVTSWADASSVFVSLCQCAAAVLACWVAGMYCTARGIESLYSLGGPAKAPWLTA